MVGARPVSPVLDSALAASALSLSPRLSQPSITTSRPHPKAFCSRLASCTEQDVIPTYITLRPPYHIWSTINLLTHFQYGRFFLFTPSLLPLHGGSGEWWLIFPIFVTYFPPPRPYISQSISDIFLSPPSILHVLYHHFHSDDYFHYTTIPYPSRCYHLHFFLGSV